MHTSSWSVFREEYPELAAQLVQLGSSLYAAGADKALRMQELDELVVALKHAPLGAIHALNLDGASREDVLVKVFDLGSTLLLDAERGKACL